MSLFGVCLLLGTLYDLLIARKLMPFAISPSIGCTSESNTAPDDILENSEVNIQPHMASETTPLIGLVQRPPQRGKYLHSAVFVLFAVFYFVVDAIGDHKAVLVGPSWSEIDEGRGG